MNRTGNIPVVFLQRSGNDTLRTIAEIIMGAGDGRVYGA